MDTGINCNIFMLDQLGNKVSLHRIDFDLSDQGLMLGGGQTDQSDQPNCFGLNQSYKSQGLRLSH